MPYRRFPFLLTRFVVDFRDPVDYERRLIELVRGLRGQPAPPDATLDAPFEPPPELPQPATVSRAQARGVFASMFDDLDVSGIVTLFTQEAMGFGATNLLLAQARQRFAAGSVTHVVPMVGTDAEAPNYFSDLGRQLGLGDGLTTSGAIGAQLPRLVRRGRPSVLILSEFENGPAAARHALASTLRKFYAAHPDEVRIVLRGGEEPGEAQVRDGDISLLAIAASCYWPELTVADVTRLYGQRFVGRALHEDVGRAILDLTGGEPRMVAHCVRRLGDFGEDRIPADAQALQAMVTGLLADCDLGPMLFVPLRREEKALPKLCKWLNGAPLPAFAGAHLDDPILRRLFWRNAPRVDDRGDHRSLNWRSDVLRRDGLRILECDV